MALDAFKNRLIKMRITAHTMVDKYDNSHSKENNRSNNLTS